MSDPSNSSEDGNASESGRAERRKKLDARQRIAEGIGCNPADLYIEWNTEDHMTYLEYDAQC